MTKYECILKVGKNVAETVREFFNNCSDKKMYNCLTETEETLKDGSTLFTWDMEQEIGWVQNHPLMKLLNNFPEYDEVDLDTVDEETLRTYSADAWKLIAISKDKGYYEHSNNIGLKAYEKFAVDRMFPQHDCCDKHLVLTHKEAADIVELFENLLVKNNIKIPSPEDEEREPDNDAALYGTVYDELLSSVENILINISERVSKGAKVIPDTFSVSD